MTKTTKGLKKSTGFPLSLNRKKESVSSIVSFFAGAGFLDLGFEMSGFNITFVNEIHEPFLGMYKYSRNILGLPSPIHGCHLGNVAEFCVDQKSKNRLTQVVRQERKKGNLVGFIGGSPCPDFSVGGKNRGRNGDKGKLSMIYVDMICSQNPDFFVFENVEGLWRTEKHRKFFLEMKQKIHSHKYITTHRLLNSMEYGVPQDRNRIFMVGFKKNLIKDMKLIKNIDENEINEDFFSWEKYKIFNKKRVLLMPWLKTSPFKEDSVIECPDGIALDLTVENWFQRNEVINHPNSIHHFKPRQGLKRFETVDEGDDSKKSFKRLHRWRYSPTACYGNNEVHLHPYKKRRISVSEALSIQSLPKEFTLPEEETLTNMFKAIGNGVPFLMSQAIARSIKDFLSENIL
ncbi:MAG: DNA cytosine methyltransferase [Cyanobacteria bacterium P01_G01_bin.54]